ncbi:MAG: ATP synthase F1 subunit gamma [Leptospiraceae bacterium]|nr:ATP synthase F1 subunit gamma [Leptospiraceae bacterium]MDW8306026.1 ATP synthase F1 subunit gamma [Leptospiraceae bacterium]
MATPREIKSRIQSIANTQKITRTMELVSTAKAKKAVDRVHASQGFAKKIRQLVQSLVDIEANFPLLRQVTKPARAAVLVLTANRGLCGGFNANVLRLAISHMQELQQQGVEVEIHLIGKKGVSYFNYRHLPYASKDTSMDDKPTYALASRYADSFMERFSRREIDEVGIIYTHYLSAAHQKPIYLRVLPIMEEVGEKKDTNRIYEPSREKILEELLPKAIRVTFFQAMLESVAGEHIARRIAMKNATDAAQEMIRTMTLAYNRARQAKITQEIAEIVGGAAAIEE